MKSFITKILIIFLIIMNSCSENEKPALPSLKVPNTFGIQTKTDNVTPGDLEQISDVGFNFIRRGFYWDVIEKETGKYDFSQYDSLYNDASTRGLRIYAVLYGGNTLYEDDGLGGIQTEEGRKGFANFAAALAEHYKGKGIIWEIWNEPNIGSFWKKGTHNTDEFAKEYTLLVKEVVKAMQNVDPDCFVVAGSVSALWQPSMNWMEECFEQGMLSSGINAWSIHPYSHITPEEQANGYNKVRDLLLKHGAEPSFSLINSERGFTVDSTRKEGWTGGLIEKADEYMAWHLVRQYLIDLLSDIRLTIYYEWKGEDFGIVWQKEKRPAYYASVNLVNQLEGYSLKERMKTGSSEDYILIFENEKGNQKFVAWTAPPPGKSPEHINSHKIQIPLQSSNLNVLMSDIYGEEAVLETQAGKVEILLEGAPKYLSIN